MKNSFEQITQAQVLEFQVSGRSIRMDSKLIGSNIAWSSRYEIVHETLTLFYSELKKNLTLKLSKELLKQLKEVASSKGNQVVYRNNRDEVLKKLKELGQLTSQILSVF
jgi:hypothetical protein